MTAGPGYVALIAALTIVPLVVLMLTSFVKISVVLSLLRNAIGAPDAPSGLVVTGLSLILTFFVMAPVAIEMAHAASASSAPKPAVPKPSTPQPLVPHSTGPTTAPRPHSTPAPPQTGGPQTGGAQTGEPQTGGPQTGGPQTGGPQTGGPQTGGPQTGGPQTGGPQTGGPQTGGPQTGGPQTGGPTMSHEPAASTGAAPLDLERAIEQLVPAQLRPQIDAAARAIDPLRGFLGRHARPRDRETFAELARGMGRTVSGDELWVLAPAFVTTELREAFAIALLIFLPFLIIDLVVGLGLAALGLTATSPQAIALPFKLLLFVSVDGWRLLVDGLLRGYM
jgi:flagellar biosynthesis protein FliP